MVLALNQWRLRYTCTIFKISFSTLGHVVNVCELQTAINGLGARLCHRKSVSWMRNWVEKFNPFQKINWATTGLFWIILHTVDDEEGRKKSTILISHWHTCKCIPTVSPTLTWKLVASRGLLLDFVWDKITGTWFSANLHKKNIHGKSKVNGE